MVAKAAFMFREDAKKFCDANEPYKHSGQFNRVEELPIFNGDENAVEFFVKEGREKALAKLTPAERKLLGL